MDSVYYNYNFLNFIASLKIDFYDYVCFAYTILCKCILSWGGSHSCLSVSQKYACNGSCVLNVPHRSQWSVLCPKLDLQLCMGMGIGK